MDTNQKREIILKHYQSPLHKGLENTNDYLRANTTNESCIDEVNLVVKIEDGIIVDARYDGEACAMCTSSTSVMIELLIGKTLEEGEILLREFEAMVEGRSYDAKKLKDANVYDDIAKQPNRKKCVLLPWWAFQKILNQKKEEKKNEK